MASVRRSGREAKQVELYGNFSQSSNRNNGTKTDEEDQSEEEEVVVMKAPLKSAMKKGKTARVNSESRTSTFDIVSTKKGTNFDGDVNRWVEDYKRNKLPTMVELVNFILYAAGAKRDWIASDTDLDPLGPSEFAQMLQGMIEEASDDKVDQYPLMHKTKGSGYQFRDKFRAYFEQLGEKIHSLPTDSSKKSLHPTEILHVLIDQLVSLSSLRLPNIRDAVTEAACSLGKVILNVCTDLKDQIAVAERQMKAEESKGSKANLKSNPKYSSLVKSRDEAKKEMDNYYMLSDVIVKSLIVHRIRDTNDSVRAITLEHLYDFILFDPVEVLKTENLKYVGYCCFDYSAGVRLNAVEVILKLLADKNIVANLNEFVEHFLGRFVSIAATDSDHNVALKMIQALRLMQENALLDEVAEDVLDCVDVIVFDEAATARVRQEALSFLMDHTEGFDVDEQPVEAKGKGKNKKGANNNSDDAKALARRQQNALQLETLTEFAEHHLQGSNYEVAKYLAEACIDLPHYDVLFDWSTIVSLLLRENEELISSALRPTQSALLLQLFATSALHVMKSVEEESGDAAVEDAHQSLIVCLQKNISSLISRFRDDNASLVIVVDLMFKCNLDSSSGATGSKNFKSLLKMVTDLFNSVNDESILEKIVLSFRKWKLSEDVTIASAMISSLKDILVSLWSSIVDYVGKIQEALKEGSNQNGTVSKKRNSKKHTIDHEDLEDCLLSLSSLLAKYKLLWTQIDCEAFTDINVEDIVDILVIVASFCPVAFDHLSGNSQQSVSVQQTNRILSLGKNAVRCINSMVLWKFKDVVIAGSKANKDIEVGGKRNREDDDAVGPKAKKSKGKKAQNDDVERENLFEHVDHSVEELLNIRDSLVGALTEWLKLSKENGNSDKKKLSVIAFQIISELRVFFPLRNGNYQSVDKLAFKPTPELFGLLKNVLDVQGAAVAEQLSSLAQNNSDANMLSNQLVSALLFPLSRNILFDVENLNKRQASAVLAYLMDPNEAIQDAVRAFAKKLKECDVEKYLEIQLTALKTKFHEHILPMIATREEALSSGDRKFNLNKHLALEAEQYLLVEELAKKFAQSLGVGKLKDDALKYLEKFFDAGLSFALSDEANMSTLGFTGLLTMYIRFLPAHSMSKIADFVGKQIETNAKLNEIVEEADSHNIALEKFVSFVNHLEGTSVPKPKNKKRADTSRVVSPPQVKASNAKRQPVTKATKAKKAVKEQPTRTSWGRGGKPVTYREEDSEEEENEEDIEYTESDLEVGPSQRTTGRSASNRMSATSQRSTVSSSSHSGNRRHNNNNSSSSSKNQNSFVMGLDIDDDNESLMELDVIPSKRRSSRL